MIPPLPNRPYLAPYLLLSPYPPLSSPLVVLHSLSSPSPRPPPRATRRPPPPQIVFKYRQPAYWYFTSYQDSTIKKKEGEKQMLHCALRHPHAFESLFLQFSGIL